MNEDDKEVIDILGDNHDNDQEHKNEKGSIEMTDLHDDDHENDLGNDHANENDHENEKGSIEMIDLLGDDHDNNHENDLGNEHANENDHENEKGSIEMIDISEVYRLEDCISSVKDSHVYRLYQNNPNRVPTPVWECDTNISTFKVDSWINQIRDHVYSSDFMLTKEDVEILLKEVKEER